MTTRKATIARRGAIGLAAIALTAGMAACSTRAPSDSLILYYKAGDGDNREWKECIQPGTAGSYPVDDEIFAIPTSVRTWNIAEQGGDTKTPIKSGTQPITQNGQTQAGIDVAVYATSDFYINVDCAKGKDSPVVKFWEKLGRRYHISSDGEDGFNQKNFITLLRNTLVPAEEKAIRQETRKYDVNTLDANLSDVWTTMERNLAPSFLNELNAKLGGDFFCGVGYNGGKKVSWTEWEATGKTDANGQPTYEEVDKAGSCPPVRISINNVEIFDKEARGARDRVYAAEQNANADRIEAQGQADAAAKLKDVGDSPGYVRLQEIEAEKTAAKEMADACKQAPSCVVVGGGGTDINVGGR